ncbi:TIGR03086 family metal-binding protein [Amycolatopsis sp. NPDC058986]|uniref:TIGR03086 family metal-binding protein n=1 Tax=unclassified Amycolatopsis TaxID=2618356 RepID=UPI00366D98D9
MDPILDRFLLSGKDFVRRLREARQDQWTWPTPCTAWNVRALVNHMTRGNLNYIRLAEGGDSADFVRLRDADALGDDPAGAYVRSVEQCAEAFARPGVLDRLLDYPLGKVPGRQALAVRTTDSVIHTWDLARAIGADEKLDAELIAWIDDNLETIYKGLDESPTASTTTHRFFAAPDETPSASRQERLLRLMGRKP